MYRVTIFDQYQSEIALSGLTLEELIAFETANPSMSFSVERVE